MNIQTSNRVDAVVGTKTNHFHAIMPSNCAILIDLNVDRDHCCRALEEIKIEFGLIEFLEGEIARNDNKTNSICFN